MTGYKPKLTLSDNNVEVTPIEQYQDGFWTIQYDFTMPNADVEATVDEYKSVTPADLGFASDTQMSSTYYGTEENYIIPDGIIGYIITGIGESSVTITRVSEIPKGVAVYLERGTSSATTTDVTTGNMLHGTTDATNVTDITGGTVYVLYNGKFVKTTSGTIPAHRCYLLVSNTTASGTRSYYDIDGSDGTTALREVKSEGVKGEKLADSAWHDLQGRKFTTKPTKAGLYILNGKKIVVK